MAATPEGSRAPRRPPAARPDRRHPLGRAAADHTWHGPASVREAGEREPGRQREGPGGVGDAGFHSQ